MKNRRWSKQSNRRQRRSSAAPSAERGTPQSGGAAEDASALHTLASSRLQSPGRFHLVSQYMRAAYEILLTGRNKVISPRQSVPPNVARAAPNPSQPQQERGGRRIAFISSARSAEGSSCSNYYPDFNTSTSKRRFSKFHSFNFGFFLSPWCFWKLRSGRSSDIRELLRGDQMLLRIQLRQLRCFWPCQAGPAQRTPPGPPPGGAPTFPAPFRPWSEGTFSWKRGQRARGWWGLCWDERGAEPGQKTAENRLYLAKSRKVLSRLQINVIRAGAQTSTGIYANKLRCDEANEQTLKL